MNLDVRPISSDDADALRSFFGRVPDGDRTFFREDVLAPGVIDSWLADDVGHRFVVVDDGNVADDEVAGYLALIPAVGWSSHVGELRVIVDPSHRRKGVGRALARRGLLEGVRTGLSKLVVEVVADQEPTLAMFSNLGFQPEALLKDHVKDESGSTHDLIVMAHFVDETWASMQLAGIDDALGD